jgi:hypothetical protein
MHYRRATATEPTTTVAGDTAVLATGRDLGIPSQKLQINVDAIQKSLKEMEVKS